MVETDVGFVSGTAGERVAASLHLPQAKDPVPGIVWCPGYTGTRRVAFYQPYIEKLVKSGYAVLVPDYRGWGDSEGARGVLDPRMQTDDIRAAITFLETRTEVDPSRIGLVGNSFGGGHVVYVCAVDARVRAGVAISGMASGEDLLRNGRRGYEWYELLDNLAEERRLVVTGAEPTFVNPNEDILIPTPERRATTVKGDVAMSNPNATPLLNVQAIMEYAPFRFADATRCMMWVCREDDPVMPWRQASGRMHQLAPDPKRLVVVRGRGHYSFYVDEFPTISNAMEAWLDAHLKGAISAVGLTL